MVEEVFGATPDDWQWKTLRAYSRGERRMSIRSCHGPGKTAVVSWIAWIQMLTLYPQKTVATAPTSSQLNDALFAEMKLWYRKLPQPLQELYEIKGTRIELKAAPESSFFSARTSRAEQPEALAGVHSDHVLLIADEASGVPEQVFEAAAGSMSSVGAQTILAGNPVRTTGLFYDTHNKLQDMWWTMHVSHADSPRVTDDFVVDIARRYGENSNAFRIRCLGEFPLADDDQIIPYELIASAMQRDIVMDPRWPAIWGVDIARTGADWNCLVERRNRIVMPDILRWQSNDLMVTAGKIVQRYKDTPPSMRPASILIDEIGLGAGVVDRCRELGLPVRGINVSESATYDERYHNLRTELWFKGRDWFEGRNVVIPKEAEGPGMPDTLAQELARPTYKVRSSGKLFAEMKSELKKRGFASPNTADAFLLTLAEDSAILSGGGSFQSGTSWNTALKMDTPGIV